MVFAVVALALIVKRVVKPQGTWAENAKPSAFIFLMTGCCIGEILEGFWGVNCTAVCAGSAAVCAGGPGCTSSSQAGAYLMTWGSDCLLHLPPAAGTAIRRRAGRCKC